MKVFIGYDSKEHRAFEIAAKTLRARSSIHLDVIPLRIDVLRTQGLLRRPTDTRGGIYDLNSNAPASTEFAISRFLVPFLAQTGPALFVDCDVVFLDDVAKLLHLFDPQYAVQVVKHDHRPTELTKMGGVPQTLYARKNWSSVMLWNTDHTANQRLSLDAVNNWPGRDLHAFSWLHDSEIGALPARWNWLVGEQPKPRAIGIAHFTRGGPWLTEWRPAAHDHIWLDAAASS